MTTINISVILCVVNLIIFWPKTTIGNQKLYSLVTDLEPLFQTQKQVITDLKRIIANKKKTYSFIRREYLRFKAEHNKSKADVNQYLDNKINGFTLIKRLTTDLDYINNITSHETRLIRNNTLKHPTFEDLNEAVGTILRLQRVYRLNVTQLADGLLETAFSGDGKTYTETFLSMTASDCFEIGKVINKKKCHNDGMEWLLEAHRLCKVTKRSLDLTKVETLHAISTGYNELNNSAQYVVWTKRLLDLKPDFDEDTIADLKVMTDIHKSRISNRANYERNLKLMSKTKKTKKKQINKKKLSEMKAMRKVFRRLCRNELAVRHDVSKRLKCWYYKGYHPFSRLAPFKAEQLFIGPSIVLIHNAISDVEIKIMKDIALPELGISSTQNSGNKTMLVNLSKGMTFNDLQSQSVQQVTRRVSDLTGLMADLQPLAVSNYGVGGHYVVHKDSSDQVDKKTLIKETKSKAGKKVNKKEIEAYVNYMSHFFRISSVLFYLSDVEQGGATVFPFLRLSVFPAKGAALVWMNLLPSGKADSRTAHAACPVLRGSKWVAMKWITGANQELHRPCPYNYIIKKTTK